jgi:hypothetical protein
MLRSTTNPHAKKEGSQMVLLAYVIIAVAHLVLAIAYVLLGMSGH